MSYDGNGTTRFARVAGTDSPMCGPAPEAALEARALRLHQWSRRRANHFHASAMADGAMDLMLALLIGELQSIEISANSLLLANDLSPADGEALLERLTQAGLVSFGSHQVEDRRRVTLTPLGSARMQSFVSTYPDV